MKKILMIIFFIVILISFFILGIASGAITARYMLLNNYCISKKMVFTEVKKEYYCKENNILLGERLLKIKWAKFSKDDKTNNK